MVIFVISLVFLISIAIGVVTARPFVPRRDQVPEMPNPVTKHNVDQALLHISRKYGIEEHHDAHDEAHGPAPIPTAARASRKRPRKVPGSATVTSAKSTKVGKPAQQVLASGLRIPARIIYEKGNNPGIPRDIVITSVLGMQMSDGAFDVQTIKGVCDTAKHFRCFTVNHIAVLFDGETGEIAPTPRDWIDRKLAFLV